MRRSPSEFASKLHDAPRLACVKPVASVHPETGSNSSLYKYLRYFYESSSSLGNRKQAFIPLAPRSLVNLIIIWFRTTIQIQEIKTVRFFLPKCSIYKALASCTTSVYVNLSKNSFLLPHSKHRFSFSGCKGTKIFRTNKTFRKKNCILDAFLSHSWRISRRISAYTLLYIMREEKYETLRCLLSLQNTFLS